MPYHPAYHNRGPYVRPDLGSSYLNYYDSRGSGGGYYSTGRVEPPLQPRTTEVTKAEAQAMEAACGSGACFGNTKH